MISCPNCQHDEIMGALFCSQCGAQLIQAAGEETISPLPQSPAAYAGEDILSFQGGGTETFLSLQVMNNGTELPLTGRKAFTLGRANEDQPVFPDVDLTPYGGFESGVSRLHAALQVKDQQVTVVDLGSSNGTKLNGERISQHTPTLLKSGDILTLGKLKLQVIIRN